jgi:4-methyl-5(b-hydroxyethyl)-thiazole monophosphate biosynthesis
MLILPGGMPGTLNLGEHLGLTTLLRDHNKKGRWIAAICAAPSILGKMHILRNQQAVCYPGFEDQLEEAFVSKDRVMVSGNIVTSRGPGCTIEFALQLASILKGEDVANAVAEGMLVK